MSYLRGGRRAPLAARSWSGRTAIAPGSLLLLYTDGLIERRAESLDVGFARLTADKGYGDDVAMVAVRPTGTTATSHVDALRASFAGLAPARPVPRLAPRARRPPGAGVPHPARHR